MPPPTDGLTEHETARRIRSFIVTRGHALTLLEREFLAGAAYDLDRLNTDIHKRHAASRAMMDAAKEAESAHAYLDTICVPRVHAKDGPGWGAAHPAMSLEERLRYLADVLLEDARRKWEAGE